MKNRFLNIVKYLDLELLFWVSGLFYLALADFSGSHFTFCPLNNMGFDFCPGCGLGMSIHHIFQLDFSSAWHSHVLGFFGLLIIIYRIIILSRNLIKKIIFYSHKNPGGQLC
ncbi:MAG: DUF2752 domain-containing protein [Ignavibacteriales bacterium]|nr:DUF2752 domain-containing protein [Ignavibacteriales bacterium]